VLAREGRDMTRIIRFAGLVLATIVVAGCAAEHYPVGGGECRPGDPVQGMPAQTCPAV
jgi:hypothetical protein